MDELEAIGKIPGVEKLAEITASGIGSVAGAWVAPWVAGRQAKARLIEARAAADIRWSNIGIRQSPIHQRLK